MQASKEKGGLWPPLEFEALPNVFPPGSLVTGVDGREGLSRAQRNVSFVCRRWGLVRSVGVAVEFVAPGSVGLLAGFVTLAIVSHSMSLVVVLFKVLAWCQNLCNIIRNS